MKPVRNFRAVLGVLAPVLFLAPPGLAQRQALVARIDSLATSPIRDGAAAGMAIWVVRGRDTLVARGYGRADLENDVPMRADHVFQIASITKQFTAAAVLRLVAEGRVELDAPITRYLPNAPVQGNPVTIRQLLSHTSGVSDYAESPRISAIKRLDWPPDSLMTLVASTPFYFPPGEQMRYSNTGFLLLGRMIEVVSGMPYAQFVDEQVLRPVVPDMHFCDPGKLVPHRAHGYAYGPQGLAPADYISPRIPFAAGGFCATAGDLTAWNLALHGGRIVPPALYAEMIRPGRIASGRSTRYGFGLMLGRLGGHRAIQHGGDIDGFASHTAYFPDDSLSVTVLVNTEGPARPDQIAAAIARIVLGPGEEEPIVRPPAGIAALAGQYGDDVRMELVQAPEGPALRMTRGPMPPVLLRPMGGMTFTDGRGRYTFERRPDGGLDLWADLGVSLVRWPRSPS